MLVYVCYPESYQRSSARFYFRSYFKKIKCFNESLLFCQRTHYEGLETWSASTRKEEKTKENKNIWYDDMGLEESWMSRDPGSEAIHGRLAPPSTTLGLARVTTHIMSCPKRIIFLNGQREYFPSPCEGFYLNSMCGVTPWTKDPLSSLKLSQCQLTQCQCFIPIKWLHL